jgi:hypothetical protein
VLTTYRIPPDDEAARAFRDAWERDRTAKSSRRPDDILHNVAVAFEGDFRQTRSARSLERARRAWREVLGSQASEVLRERAQAHFDALGQEQPAAAPAH